MHRLPVTARHSESWFRFRAPLQPGSDLSIHPCVYPALTTHLCRREIARRAVGRDRLPRRSARVAVPSTLPCGRDRACMTGVPTRSRHCSRRSPAPGRISLSNSVADQPSPIATSARLANDPACARQPARKRRSPADVTSFGVLLTSRPPGHHGLLHSAPHLALPRFLIKGVIDVLERRSRRGVGPTRLITRRRILGAAVGRRRWDGPAGPRTRRRRRRRGWQLLALAGV